MNETETDPAKVERMSEAIKEAGLIIVDAIREVRDRDKKISDLVYGLSQANACLRIVVGSVSITDSHRRIIQDHLSNYGSLQ